MNRTQIGVRGVNLWFHHDTILYRFIGQRYDICRYQKSAAIRFRFRGMRSIWDDIICPFNTTSYNHINSHQLNYNFIILFLCSSGYLKQKNVATFNHVRLEKRDICPIWQHRLDIGLLALTHVLAVASFNRWMDTSGLALCAEIVSQTPAKGDIIIKGCNTAICIDVWPLHRCSWIVRQSIDVSIYIDVSLHPY